MVTTIQPSFQAQPQTWPHLKGLKLADPEFLTPRPIDIIIGADHYSQIIKAQYTKALSFCTNSSTFDLRLAYTRTSATNFHHALLGS